MYVASGCRSIESLWTKYVKKLATSDDRHHVAKTKSMVLLPWYWKILDPQPVRLWASRGFPPLQGEFSTLFFLKPQCLLSTFSLFCNLATGAFVSYRGQVHQVHFWMWSISWLAINDYLVNLSQCVSPKWSQMVWKLIIFIKWTKWIEGIMFSWDSVCLSVCLCARSDPSIRYFLALNVNSSKTVKATHFRFDAHVSRSVRIWSLKFLWKKRGHGHVTSEIVGR